MPVDRCICHNILFSEIKKIADENGYTSVQELQAEHISSTNCKLCLPYIEAMLATGNVSFKPFSA